MIPVFHSTSHFFQITRCGRTTVSKANYQINLQTVSEKEITIQTVNHTTKNNYLKPSRSQKCLGQKI